MTFLDQIRALDKAATPAPWIAEDAKGDTVFIPALTTRYSSVMPRVGMDDGALIVSLRNAAPALAALVEAAQHAVAVCGLEGSVDKLDAALAALEAP